METWLRDFKKRSLEKFSSLPSENSEVFKHQTTFKEFAVDGPRDVSDETGFEIEHTCEPLKVTPIVERGLKVTMKKFDIDDKFVQMNNAFFDRGALIEATDDVDAGTLRIKSTPAGSAFSKLVIVAQDGSNIDIVKETGGAGGGGTTVSEDVLVLAWPGSKVTFSELQNYGKGCVHFSNKLAYVGKDASVTWNVGGFGASMSRTRTYNFLEGEGAKVEDLQLAFGSGDQQFDGFSNLVHIGRSTSARCMAKGAFRDRSKSIFKGMIKIREGAKNASSYLACHGMLLSKEAKASTIPSLEIDTNDVKATHSASVSPIDEEKLFYLESRGIAREDAKRMITTGYFDPLIRSISSDEIRAKMRYLVEVKWNGEPLEDFEKKRLQEFVTEDAIKSGDIFEGHYKYR